ncbi:hypothetical protein V6N13_025357 [Hibiscus sabdariffa]
MGSTVPGAMVQAWGLAREEVDQPLLWDWAKEVPMKNLVPFLRVALSCSKALMKLALMSRSRPSKALWCLAFVVPTFTALGANDGTLGIVAKTPVRDPSSIQVYDVHLQPLWCVLASVLF